MSIERDGDIKQATLSPDQKWLAYKDDSGIKILERPFESNDPTLLLADNEEQTPFIFSSDSQFLAYSDLDGLKLYDISQRSTSLLVKNVFESPPVNVEELRKYYPLKWSPDGQWLWVNELRWEGLSRILIHRPTNKIYEFSGCHSDVSWLFDGSAFVVAVSYSDYLGCGEEDGVYLISTIGGKITEKRIYYENEPNDPRLRESSDLTLRPQGDMISFVQITYPNTNIRNSSLILKKIEDDSVLEIDSSHDEIGSLVWSADGKTLFYVIRSSTESRIVSLAINTLEKIELASVPRTLSIISYLPKLDWLVVGSSQSYKWSGVYLVNSVNGDVVKIADLGDANLSQPYLGFEDLTHP